MANVTSLLVIFNIYLIIWNLILPTVVTGVNIVPPEPNDVHQNPGIKVNLHTLIDLWPKQEGSRILPALGSQAILDGIEKLKIKYNLAIQTETESNKKLIAKLKYLHNEINSTKKSGRGLQKLLDRYKSTDWTWKIKYEEIQHKEILNSMDIMKQENDKLKQALQMVQKKLSTALKTNSNLKRHKQKLCSKLVAKARGMKRRYKSRKPWSNLSNRRKSQILSQILEDCQVNLDFLGLYGFMATEVTTVVN